LTEKKSEAEKLDALVAQTKTPEEFYALIQAYQEAATVICKGQQGEGANKHQVYLMCDGSSVVISAERSQIFKREATMALLIKAVKDHREAEKAS